MTVLKQYVYTVRFKDTVHSFVGHGDKEYTSDEVFDHLFWQDLHYVKIQGDDFLFFDREKELILKCTGYLEICQDMKCAKSMSQKIVAEKMINIFLEFSLCELLAFKHSLLKYWDI